MISFIKKITTFLLFSMLFLPVMAFAESAGYTSPMQRPGFILFILVYFICKANKKNPIGGWLLYYYITTYIGFIFGIIMSAMGFAFNTFDDKFAIIHDAVFYILIFIEIIITFFMMSKKMRSWRQISLLKSMLLTMSAYSLVAACLEAYYKMQVSMILSGFTSVINLAWFFYFMKSKRVKMVFHDNLWDPEVFYPSPKNTNGNNAPSDIKTKTMFPNSPCPACGKPNKECQC